MPQISKGARLWLRPESRRADGSLRNAAALVIRDGAKMTSTGCGKDDRAGAESALADYIRAKYDPRPAKGRPIGAADVLNLYLRNVAPKHARPHETAGRAMFMIDAFGNMAASEITPQWCRDYAAQRGKPAAARRELEDLRAAIRHWEAEGHPATGARVALPPAAPARERWADRSEAARLLWAAWRMRESQNGKPTGRYTARHAARFALIAIYTGTRASAICEARFTREPGKPYIDLDAGIFYRRADGERETKKRKPPIPLPPRLLAHLRRWKRLGIATNAPVEWNGEPVTRVRKSFAAAAKAAGLEWLTPHVLRHTAATWLMQGGASAWQAGGYLGMSAETLERRYGHHHPDYLAGALAAIGRGGRAKAAAQAPHRNAENDSEQNKNTVRQDA